MEHSSSVEMKSSKHVRQMLISRDLDDYVLFEGNLGKSEKLVVIEGAVFMVHGSNGISAHRPKRERVENGGSN